MKNRILKTIAYIDGTAFLIFACMLDGEPFKIPAIGCLITGGYMALFAYVNNWFNDFE